VAVVEQLGEPVGQYAEKQSVRAAVIRQDLDSCCLEISTGEALLDALAAAQRRSAVGDGLRLEQGQRLHGSVLLSRPDRLLVVLSDRVSRGALVFLPGRLHLNDVTESARHKVGEKISVLVMRKMADGEPVLAHDVENVRLYAVLFMHMLMLINNGDSFVETRQISTPPTRRMQHRCREGNS